MVNVVVDYKHRGKGLGTAMILEFLKVSKRNGLKTVNTEVKPENWRMLNLLRGLGFVPDEGTNGQVTYNDYLEAHFVLTRTLDDLEED
jgi:RimJ/RimL family protein N-acetyltransferase